MKRSGSLARKTPLRAGTKHMRSGRSTGSPTKAQAKRLHEVTHQECIACTLNRGWSLATAYVGGCDAHHLLSGGRRISHSATVGLCPWHHRGVKPYDGITDTQATEIFGPSLQHGSKPFHATYGSDAELLAMQNRIMGES